MKSIASTVLHNPSEYIHPWLSCDDALNGTVRRNIVSAIAS